MPTSEIHAVTGAFGCSGRYIARRLLQAGKTVRTLTNSSDMTGEFEGVLVKPKTQENDTFSLSCV